MCCTSERSPHVHARLNTGWVVPVDALSRLEICLKAVLHDLQAGCLQLHQPVQAQAMPLVRPLVMIFRLRQVPVERLQRNGPSLNTSRHLGVPFVP